MADASAAPGGRPALPGIPSRIDRVSAEMIWNDNCSKELEYVRRRSAQPPKATHFLGRLRKFEIFQHPSYVEVRPIYADDEDTAPVKQLDACLTDTTFMRSPSMADMTKRPSMPSSSTGRPLGPGRSLRDMVELTRPRKNPATAYAYRFFSENHMGDLEVEPSPHMTKALSASSLLGIEQKKQPRRRRPAIIGNTV